MKNVHVYEMNDYEWYASKWDMKKTNDWYKKGIWFYTEDLSKRFVSHWNVSKIKIFDVMTEVRDNIVADKEVATFINFANIADVAEGNSKEFNMTNTDVMYKLIGNLVPYGESNHDDDVYSNLDDAEDLLRDIIEQFISNAEQKGRPEHSISKIGVRCHQTLKDMVEYINDNID